jgi:predicted PurR-regulated permease PerM
MLIPFVTELGFIIFIVSAYVYFLYQDMVHSTFQNMYKLGTSTVTIALVATGAYYLYKNPEQVPELITKFLKKPNK